MAGHVCPWWHAYTFDHRGRRLFHKPEKMFHPYIEPGMKVMDVGCGMGYFSIGMAKMVGDKGEVVAVDSQPQMLDVVRRRADRAGVADRIRTHVCEAHTLGIDERSDFILAFWMVHEVRDHPHFFTEIVGCMKPSARFLLAEPTFHVSRGHYHQIIDTAVAAGLRLCEKPRIAFSRTALFDVVHGESSKFPLPPCPGVAPRSAGRSRMGEG